MNKKKKLFVVCFIVGIILLSGIVTFGAILFKSYAVSRTKLDTGIIEKIYVDDASSENIEINVSNQNLSFNQAGDYEEVTFNIINRTNSIIQYKYEFSFAGSSYQNLNTSFASCVYVYFNNEFIDTLGNICANDSYQVENGKIDFTNFLNKATQNNYSSQTDVIKFELHSGSDNSYFDNSDVLSFNIRAYAQTPNYERYMYVSNEEELYRAITDLNSKVLPSDEKIVLLNNITLSSAKTIEAPCCLDLNGFELIINAPLTLNLDGTFKITSKRKMSLNSLNSSSNIIINNQNSILDIDDFENTSGTNIGYLYSNIVTASNYDVDGATTLALNRLKNKFKNGIIEGNSINLFGALSFYNFSITVSDGLTYSSPNLTAKATNVNKDEIVTFNNNDFLMKVIGNHNDQLLQDVLDNELLHLVRLATTSDSGEIINTNAADLFLPTSIKSKNCTIEWKTSDDNLMSNTGIISKDLSGDQLVTIYATIKINNEIYQKQFDIRIMSQNHDTIFQYFVAQLSPIEIEVVYNGDNQAEAYYYLPIVDSNYDVLTADSYEGFDYRSSYRTPEAIETGTVGYDWQAFSNVGFTYLKYAPNSAYNFISIDDNAQTQAGLKGVAVYLNSATFQTYAQINVSAKFNGDDQVYTSSVNVLISLGYNTELNDLVFNKIDSELTSVDVLQNILNTRKELGMLNETGDFYLDGKYQTYNISYQIPTLSQNVITSIEGYSVSMNGDNEVLTLVGSISGSQAFTSEQISNIDRYKICLNAEAFDSSDSDFGISTILSMPTGNQNDTASRILYFTCPGVIKCDLDGFSNMSVFNSVKYQVFNELKNLANESYEGDVVEDNYTTSNDTSSFTVSNNVVTNHTKAYILRHDANLCKTLAFDLSENYTQTDNHIIYGLSKIIDWALSDSTLTFGDQFNGNNSFESSFVTTYANYQSNGKVFISVDEKAVIKAYYLEYINSSESHFDELWDNVAYLQKDSSGVSKFTLINGSEFLTNVQNFYNNTSTYGANQGDGTYSKFLEIFQWAHNDKDFEGDGMAPCYGLIGTANWSTIIGTDYTTWKMENYYGAANWASSKYNTNVSDYLEDETEYFSTAELEILFVALLNSKQRSSSNGPSTAAKQFIQSLRDRYFVIPEYFEINGIRDFISQAYLDLDKSLSGSESTGFSAELSQFRVSGVSFTTPHITLLDGSTRGFDYFPNLEALCINGSVSTNLKAFHQTSTLTSFFNRVTSNNKNLISLSCVYCSDSNIDFSLENISELKNLQKIDLYHNHGIDNIGALLKLELSNISYIDVADIDLLNEYSDFTLRAINLKSNQNPIIYYTPNDTNYHTTFTDVLSNDAEGLIYIDEFYDLLAENSNLAQTVYTSTKSNDVQWKIEEGNGISLVNDTSHVIPSVYPMYTKYYIIQNTFTYNGYTFEAGNLYYILNDANNNMNFGLLNDNNGNPIKVTVENVPSALSQEEADQYISDHGLTPTNENGTTPIQTNQGSFSETSINTARSATPSNGTSLITSQSQTTAYIYDANNELIDSSPSYGFGYIGSIGNKTRVSTSIYSDYSITGSISEYIEKFYAVQNSYGMYEVNYARYLLQRIGGGYSIIHTTTTTESFVGWYICNDRTYSWFRYNYSFIDLLYNYPDAHYVKIGSKTYNLYDSSYYSTNSETSDSRTDYDNTSSCDLEMREIYFTAMIGTSSLFDEIKTNLTNTYISLDQRIQYYDMGEQSTPTYDGTYKIELSSSGGFTLTEAGDTNSIKMAYAMQSILDEANSHLNDKYFGLYYHNYYAYAGQQIEFNGFNYITNGVYQLDIGSDGKFYFKQSSNSNENYYTELTGTYTAVTNIVAGLSASDIGKIYYYSGTANQGMTQGTNIWYQVRQNPETGAYEFIKFGTLWYKYAICNVNSGNFNDTTVLNNYALPEHNQNGLYVICNNMEYMDSSFFENGYNNSTFTYGIGATRNAVFAATITASNGTKYERKFVVSVHG